MQDYPHRYTARAKAAPEGEITVASEGLPALQTLAPPEFGGPGGRWSPETLLVASVSDCLVLTFRAIARASKVDWNSLRCEAEGLLDRVDGVTRFTEFNVRARLSIPPDTDRHKAERLVEKAERLCLITRSLNGETHMEVEVLIDD